MTRRDSYDWFALGDLNGFFGLMFDNLTVLSFLAGTLIVVFKFPADIVYTRMFPGTAFGVLLRGAVGAAARAASRSSRVARRHWPRAHRAGAARGRVRDAGDRAALARPDPLFARRAQRPARQLSERARGDRARHGSLLRP